MKNIFLTSLFCFVCISCNSQIFSDIATKGHNKYFMPTKMVSDEKEIVIMGMLHLAEQSFYDKVAVKIDSLRELGYTVHYEGLKLSVSEDTEVNDRYERKFRKLTNDALYASDSGKNKKKHKKFVYQMDVYHGVDYKNDVWNDASTKSLVDEYEKQFGEVTLETCDWETSLDDKYKCGKTSRNIVHHLLYGLREGLMVEKLLEEKNNKIVYVVGNKHKPSLMKRLEDKGFEFVHW